MGGKRILQKLSVLVSRVDEAEFHVSEETERISLATDYVPKVSQLLEEASQLLHEVQDWYDSDDALNVAPQDNTNLDSLSDIGALISSELAARNVADLAFVARGGLRSCREELRAAANQRDFFQIASACDTGMRRLRKALVSVESSAAEFEGVAVPRRHLADLEISLEIRKLYGELNRELVAEGPPPDGELEASLDAIAQRLVELRKLDLYPLLRIGDRVEMRRLYKRILDWLQQPQPDLIEGHRLWQDVSGFAHLLLQINHREELREHDRLMVAQAWHVLFAKRAAQVPPELLQELQRMLGRDEELDQLILHPERSRVEDWRLPLERLRAGLEAVAAQELSTGASLS